MMDQELDPKYRGAVFSIDKPKGWTSFDVVDHLRKQLKKKFGLKKLKVGHAGTLDPMATGLLICCCGPMTKRINEFQEGEKTYEAKVRFGYRTASNDAETEIVSEHSTKGIDEECIEEALENFKGKIEQVPPAHSAVRVNGKRAYEEARKGKDPGLGARNVEVHQLELEGFVSEIATLRIRCSKGTYIRSLARDLGDELGTGAYLTELRRTGIGRYDVEDAFTIDELRAHLKEDPDPESDPERRN